MSKYINTGIALNQNDGSIGYAYFRTEKERAIEQTLKGLLNIYLDQINTTGIKIDVQKLKVNDNNLVDVQVVVDLKGLNFDISEE